MNFHQFEGFYHSDSLVAARIFESNNHVRQHSRQLVSIRLIRLVDAPDPFDQIGLVFLGTRSVRNFNYTPSCVEMNRELHEVYRPRFSAMVMLRDDLAFLVLGSEAPFAGEQWRWRAYPGRFEDCPAAETRCSEVERNRCRASGPSFRRA
jgi:hypothetical protein